MHDGGRTVILGGISPVWSSRLRERLSNILLLERGYFYDYLYAINRYIPGSDCNQSRKVVIFRRITVISPTQSSPVVKACAGASPCGVSI